MILELVLGVAVSVAIFVSISAITAFRKLRGTRRPTRPTPRWTYLIIGVGAIFLIWWLAQAVLEGNWFFAGSIIPFLSWMLIVWVRRSRRSDA